MRAFSPLATCCLSIMFCERVSSFSIFPMTLAGQARVSSVKNHLSADDSAEYATPLKLTTLDKERFSSVEQSSSRQTVMPVLILDAMLPKQELTLDSSDPKMARLVHYCLENNCELGMLGINPNTQSPLSRGVTVSVEEQNIQISSTEKSVVLTVTGGCRMEVQSQPWLDPSGSFYLSKIEYMDARQEPALSLEQQAIVEHLSETLPKAMKQWFRWVLKSGKTDKAGLRARLHSLGPMPTNFTDRAFWVASALNPLPSLDACLEIRPAMLSCTNDYERTVLACQALQSSTDHLSGKQQLL